MVEAGGIKLLGRPYHFDSLQKTYKGTVQKHRRQTDHKILRQTDPPKTDRQTLNFLALYGTFFARTLKCQHPVPDPKIKVL
jgi:hypothetical protein